MASFKRGAVPVGIMVVIADGDGGHVVMGSRNIQDVSIDYYPGRFLPSIELRATCLDWDTVMMPAEWSFVPQGTAELPAPVAVLGADDERARR